MSIFLFIVFSLYILVFFAAVVFSVKFQFGEESNDERGKKILNTSYAIAFPLVILGWFIITLVDDFVRPFSFDEYKIVIWYLVTGTYIVHAAALLILRRLT